MKGFCQGILVEILLEIIRAATNIIFDNKITTDDLTASEELENKAISRKVYVNQVHDIQ